MKSFQVGSSSGRVLSGIALQQQLPSTKQTCCWTFKFHSRPQPRLQQSVCWKGNQLGNPTKSWDPDSLKSAPRREGAFSTPIIDFLPLQPEVWWIVASGWYFDQIWPPSLYLTLGAKAVCPVGVLMYCATQTKCNTLDCNFIDRARDLEHLQRRRCKVCVRGASTPAAPTGDNH